MRDRGTTRIRTGVFESYKNMSKNLLWAILIAVFVLVLNNLSIFYGYLTPRPGLVFLARHEINSQDTYTYVSFIEQARQGRVLFENLYQSEPQHADLFRPSYLIIGRFASIFRLPSIAGYHLFRFLFSVIFLILLYNFLKLFFKTEKTHLFAFALVLLSSGVGFLVSFFTSSSDFWIPESNTFLSLAESPHFILSQILMLSIFWLYLRSLHKFSYGGIALASLLCVWLGFEHPFNLMVIIGVVVISCVWMRITLKKDLGVFIWAGLPIVAASVIGLLIQVFETYSNPTLKSWASQNSLNSPASIEYLIGYGLLLVFGLFGVERFLKSKNSAHILILSWVAVVAILLYSPVFFQRRFSEGLHIPVAILASMGLIFCIRFVSGMLPFQKKFRIVLFFSVVSLIVLSVSTVLVVQSDISIIGSESTNSYYYHLQPQEIGAMNYVRQNTTSQDIILSNWFYGNMIPGFTGRRVFVGHKVQTPDFNQKIDLINQFLLNKNSTSALKFLQDNGITYVYVGVNDTLLSYGFKPDTKPYLEKVFDVAGARVYKVIKD